MKTLTVRNLKDDVIQRFAELAAANHRNAEAHARFLIEREVSAQPADTCGEILDWLWSTPAPDVDIKVIDRILATRGRRSNRP